VPSGPTGFPRVQGVLNSRPVPHPAVDEKFKYLPGSGRRLTTPAAHLGFNKTETTQTIFIDMPIPITQLISGGIITNHFYIFNHLKSMH
jgi:hypothetical protein